MPLSQYREYMAAFQQAAHQTVTPAAVRQAVSHLVLSDRVINQIGPAVASGQSMFVYGPPGNGKTVIAQALHNLLDQRRSPSRMRLKSKDTSSSCTTRSTTKPCPRSPVMS